MVTNIGCIKQYTETKQAEDWDYKTMYYLIRSLRQLHFHGAEFFLRSQQCNKLAKKFPAFYETRRFITVFTKARHESLSWARWIQLAPQVLFS
jgi:ribosomal protein S6